MTATSRLRRAGATVMLGFLAWGSLGADDVPQAATIVVASNRFQPFDVHVAPGGTVTWDVREAGHTIVADDGRFDSRGGGGGTAAPGAAFSHTFDEVDEVVRYHCTLHGGPGGQGMSGVVVVGDPQVPRPADPVIRVPQDIAVLSDAVAVATPGERIELAPGVHHVDRPLDLALRDASDFPRGLTIIGTGRSPEDVTIAVAPRPQLGLPPSVVHVTGSFVTLAHLTVDASAVRTDGAGVHLDGAHQVALVDVVVDAGGLTRDAVRVTDADGAALRGTAVRNAARAGVAIDPCTTCGVLLDGVTSHDNLVGVLLSGAAGVLVRDSHITGNAAGIVARSEAGRTSTVTVTRSTIVDNTRRDRLPSPTSPTRRLATGAGLWLDGTNNAVVAGNRVEGNTFGIAVSGGALGVTVIGNDLDDNDVDLAWDGLGTDTCFVDNDHASSEPPALEVLAPCDQPTVGIPYPPVDVALVAAAYA